MAYLEFGNIFPDVVAVAIPLLPKGNGTVASIELGIEGGAAEPLPITGVTSGFVVDQKFLKDLCSAFPGNVRSTPGQETRD